VIVTWEQLPEYRGRVAMVDGGFDPLHDGHVAYFAAAAELGVPVLCNLASDAYVAEKHPVLLAQPQRAAVIGALRAIDLVHCSQTTTLAVLLQLRPRYYVKGADWRDRLPPEQVAACAEHAISIVYVETVLNSSTALLRRQASPER
jgi:bifunctional ADP-heptose synthase (sugar kinase/adenylyltransferase)